MRTAPSGRLVVAAALALVVLLATACAPDQPASPIRIARPTTLAGPPWRLLAINGQAVPAAAGATVMFGTPDLNGNGGCNSFGGPYAYNPETGAVRIGSLVTTKRACVEPGRNEVEAAFLRALQGATAASIDPDGRLVLSGDGELLLEVGPQEGGPPIEAPPSEIAGPS